jgi:hypothetical protein
MSFDPYKTNKSSKSQLASISASAEISSAWNGGKFIIEDRLTSPKGSDRQFHLKLKIYTMLILPSKVQSEERFVPQLMRASPSNPFQKYRPLTAPSVYQGQCQTSSSLNSQADFQFNSDISVYRGTSI